MQPLPPHHPSTKGKDTGQYAGQNKLIVEVGGVTNVVTVIANNYSFTILINQEVVKLFILNRLGCQHSSTRLNRPKLKKQTF